ncbi:MAG: hypothetical protein ACT4OI_01130 [Methanobacteriota archaeon]
MARLVGILGLAALLTLVVVSPAAAAGDRTTVRGGGAGTFGADLDGDGDVDGSRFGVGAVLLADGTARGHFECLMAGAADFLGLKLMAVEGNVGSGSLGADGSVVLRGTASVNLAGGEIFRGVPFEVTLWPGGPGLGKMALRVVGAFDGVPGDTVAGNGDYDLATETVTSGQIVVGG